MFDETFDETKVEVDRVRWIRAVLARGMAVDGFDGIDREPDVATDPHLANSRAVGGGPAVDADSGCTTGTGANQLFVGRVSGEDIGSSGLSGAEARAASHT